MQDLFFISAQNHTHAELECVRLFPRFFCEVACYKGKHLPTSSKESVVPALISGTRIRPGVHAAQAAFELREGVNPQSLLNMSIFGFVQVFLLLDTNGKETKVNLTFSFVLYIKTTKVVCVHRYFFTFLNNIHTS